jgi:DNA-directed RNA polymerase subunit L
MLKHRVEMLPVNVNPEEASVIRDTKIELRILPEKASKEVRVVTTDDFTVDSTRNKVLLRDRDFDTPCLFVRVRPNESVHLTGRLALETQDVSQVCNVATKWHVDPERAKEDKKAWVEAGNDPQVFDNFYIQKSYSRDEKNRPNWIDMHIESVGVLSAKDILKYAVGILRKQLQSYMKDALENISREKEEGSYRVLLQQGGHTIGALVQEVMYGDLNVDFTGYDIPHPLRPEMELRFHTKKTPESVLKTAGDAIEEYCSVVEKSL